MSCLSFQVESAGGVPGIPDVREATARGTVKVCCHLTNILNVAEDGSITIAAKHMPLPGDTELGSRHCFRPGVSFSINRRVPNHEDGDWDGKKFAVLVRFDQLKLYLLHVDELDVQTLGPVNFH